MLSLFKLKKKSKKDKGQRQDDEKENTSSPTKVKKSSAPSAPSASQKYEKDKKQEKQTPTAPESKRPSSKNYDAPAATAATTTVQKNANEHDLSGDDANRAKRRSLRDHVGGAKNNGGDNQQPLAVETNNNMTTQGSSQQPSPLSSKSAATTINIQHPRHPVLSASDAAHSASFVRGNFLSSTISGSDLHRFLNSGYLNGDSYLSRGVEPKTPKSPHFHRPPNFSYSRSGPNYVTHRTSASRGGGMRALITASSASSDARRVNRATLSSMDRGRSVSPMQQQQTTTTTTTATQNADESVTETTTNTLNTTHVSSNAQLSARGGNNLDSEEPIRLSKFSGGYMPDPMTPRKIESLDWPAPPYPAAVPELRARSRSSSNRRAPSTVTSIRGGDLDEDDEEDEDEEMMQQRIDVTNPNQPPQQSVRQSTGAASVSSSMARAKASRPNSKLNYHNKLFDNDYDDYLLRYRSDKEFRRVLNKSTSGSAVGGGTRATRYQSGESSTCEDLNPEMHEEEELSEVDNQQAIDSDEEATSSKATPMTPKMEEISKLEHESSMAHAVLSEIKAHQRIISHKLKIDPWKASRTPNAKAEPTIRTRFESPVNASPSRIFNFPRSGAYTPYSGASSVTNNLLSPVTATAAGSGGAASSTSCFGSESGILSPPPIIQQQSSHSNLLSPTKSSSHVPPAQPYHYHKPQFAASASSITGAGANTTSYLMKNNYINSSNRVITNASSAHHKQGLNSVLCNMAGS